MKTSYADAEEILPEMKGKLTIRNEKSSHLSYSLVSGFSLPSTLKYRSRYDAYFTGSVVYFISSSLGVDAMALSLKRF